MLCELNIPEWHGVGESFSLSETKITTLTKHKKYLILLIFLGVICALLYQMYVIDPYFAAKLYHGDTR